MKNRYNPFPTKSKEDANLNLRLQGKTSLIAGGLEVVEYEVEESELFKE